MTERLLYTLAAEVSIAGRIGELHVLTARLYWFHYKDIQTMWVLQAELDGIPLQAASWDFTTIESPPTTSIQHTLAERIGRRLECGNYEVIFNYLEWQGV